MKKELYGIFLFFLIVFFSVSLFSFHNSDPCIGASFFNTPDQVHNLFGLAGSHAAGLFIWLFGLGAFWFPVLLALVSLFMLNEKSPKSIWFGIAGGLVLMICSGAMLFLFQDEYQFSHALIPAGGIIGSFITTILLTYANVAGTMIILGFFLLSGFMLATGISLVALVKFLFHGLASLYNISLSQIKKISQTVFRYFVTPLVQNYQQRQLRKKEAQQEVDIIDIPAALPPTAQEEYIYEDDDFDESEMMDHGEEIAAPNLTKDPSAPAIAPIPEEEPQYEILPEQQKNEYSHFTLPPISFLDEKASETRDIDTEKLYEKAKILEEKLKNFHVTGKVVEILPGPVITTFEYRPSPGIKLSKIVGLSDDLALALSAVSIRIVAPIPGRDVVGIEIPNKIREMVNLREMIASREFCESSSLLTLALGKDLMGRPVATAMDKMPHLLIAGATGTGKSVGLNSMIISLLYKATPDEIKLIMIDPKRIELSVYNDIPHLIAPVVTDMKKATNALFWAVKEMERRYELLEKAGLRNLVQYNDMVRQELKNQDQEETLPLEILPYIVIIVDELSDLMMVASKDVEFALTRLAQMARAAGIHIILATQRPSADVLTGTIKANFPTRISFQVSSKIDGRIIIDQGGAENLLGNGDMLFCPPGTGKLMRIQGAFISEKEIAKITAFLKEQRKPDYNEEITKGDEQETTEFDDSEYDEKYDEAVAVVTQSGQASISYVQRRLRIGYNRAARLIEIMEHEGIIGPQIGSKPREILVKSYEETP